MTIQVGSLFASLSLDTLKFTQGLGKADRTFGTTMESFRRSSVAAGRSLEGLSRTIGSAGFGAGVRQFSGLNQQARLLPASLRGVTVAMAGLGGIFGGAALARGFDTFTSIGNQLRSLEGGLGNTASQFKMLLSVANRSRADIGATVTLFARLAKSQPELGFERISKSVETIQKALQLGGATTAEAASAAIQFSQAIGSGVLQGDELRAVLESPLGNALAKGLKATTAEMRKLGSEGKLTAGLVMKALDEIGPTIDEQFGRSTATIGQSMTVLQNEITATIGRFDQTYGVTSLLSEGVMGLARNLDVVATAAQGAAVALSSAFVGRIGGGGVAALGASFRALATDAEAGVAGARAELSTLEDALKRAVAERYKLTGFTGPMNPKGFQQFNDALALNNRRIAELSGALPRARTELIAAQKAASGLGLVMTGTGRAFGSLVSFLGGPWGVAFTAAAAGATLLGARMAAAAQEAREYEEVSSRLLGSVEKFSSKAADIVATEKFNAELRALGDDAETARRELFRLLAPIVQIAAEIDSLRDSAEDFRLYPDAERTVGFIQEQIDKLAKGGTLQQFNDALQTFQERYKVVPAGAGLFEQIADQAAQADTALQTLAIALDRLREKQAQGIQLSGIGSPDAAIGSALTAMNRDRLARAAADATGFAAKVAEIKSKEKQIADSLAAAVTKAGYTLNAGLQNYIDGLARAQALADQVTVATTAAKQLFQITQKPNVRYVPGSGPNAALEQGNSAIQLAQLLQQAAKIRELRAQIEAEKQTLGSTGGLLRNLFGDRADSAEVKGALQGIEQNVQRIFSEFSTGKMSAVEAFNAIESIRTELQQFGAEPGPLDAFLEQIGSAITGIPDLSAEIVDLTRKMKELAAAAREVRLPGGSVVKRAPGPDSSIAGFASGGAFRVGGGGGTDSQLVQFMASPNETVAVFTPSQMKAFDARLSGSTGNSTIVNQQFDIATPDAASFRTSRRQIQMDIADAVQAAVNRTR